MDVGNPTGKAAYSPINFINRKLGWLIAASFVLPVAFIIIRHREILALSNAEALLLVTHYFWPATAKQFIELKTYGSSAEAANYVVFSALEIISIFFWLRFLNSKLKSCESQLGEVTGRDVFALLVLCVVAYNFFVFDQIPVKKYGFTAFFSDAYGSYLIKAHLYFLSIVLMVLLFRTMIKKG